MVITCTIAFLWALGEGICFFLVPDIALSYLALRGWKHALGSVISAVVGSLLAAIFLYVFLDASPGRFEKMVLLWQNLPGFYPKMLSVAQGHLAEHGAWGLLTGPSSGIPFRFYVLEAWQQKIPLAEILACTPFARLQRILLAPIAVLILNFGARRLSARFAFLNSPKVKPAFCVVLTIYWVGLYYWYWGEFLPGVYGE